MNAFRVGRLFGKELKETLRDVRTLLLTYGVPVFVYPLLALAGGKAFAVQQAKERTEIYRVAWLGEDALGLQPELARLERTRWEQIPEGREQEILTLLGAADKGSDEARSSLRDLLRAEGLSALLAFSTRRLAGDELVNQRIRVLYDETDFVSLRASTHLGRRLSDSAIEWRKRRLSRHLLDEERLAPLKVDREGLAGTHRFLGRATGMAIPFFVIVLLVLSAFYPALNATVGERERGTLTTLLMTQARPIELVLGKFLAVLLSTCVGIVIYLVSFAGSMTALTGPPADRLAAAPANPAAWIPLLLISTAALIAAISLAIGLFARKQAEGQALLSTFMLLTLFPVGVAVVGEFSPNGFTVLVPFVNIAVLARSFQVDAIAWPYLAGAIAANGVAAVLTLRFCAYLIRREYWEGTPHLLASRALRRIPVWRRLSSSS